MDRRDQRIDEYLKRLLEVNKVINLTRIDSYESARVLHVEDSLSALPEVNEAPLGLYGDMGTGGGFPGVLLAFATGRETVLIDSVQKKVKVVYDILESMGCSDGISVFPGRIEDLARARKEEFAVLTARALSRLVPLMELSSPLLVRGGRLICYKAHVEGDEMDAALSVQEKLGMSFVSRRSFVLSDGVTSREIVVFEKTSASQIQLPRRVGLAQRSPLA